MSQGGERRLGLTARALCGNIYLPTMISRQIITLNPDDSSDLVYKNGQGSFFIYYPNGVYGDKDVDAGHIDYIAQCREIFENNLESAGAVHIGFAYHGLNVASFNRFWSCIERRLGIKKRTIIYKTNQRHVIILKVPRFWIDHTHMRGFLTLFMRCGAVYYGGQLNAALRAYDLTNDIIKWVKWFLDGHTKAAGELRNIDTGGLVYHLEGVDEDYQDALIDHRNYRDKSDPKPKPPKMSDYLKKP